MASEPARHEQSLRILWIEPELAAISGGLRYNSSLRDALAQLGVESVTCCIAPERFHAEQVDTAVAQYNPTAIIIDGLLGSSHPEVFAEARQLRVLLIHLSAAAAAEAEGISDPQIARDEQVAIDTADAVLTVSQWSAEQLRRRYRRSQIYVAEPGAPEPRHHFQRTGAERGKPITFVCVAALNPLKNHRLIFEALEPLQAMPWQLVLAGPGGETEYGRQLIAEAQRRLPGHVTYCGALSSEQVEDLWDHADALVLPSLIETYGMVVTEACAAGVPAFISANTGAAEAAADAGVAVDPHDPHQWRRALEQFLCDAVWRDRMAQAAQWRGHQLPSWQVAASTVTDLIADSLG